MRATSGDATSSPSGTKRLSDPSRKPHCANAAKRLQRSKGSHAQDPRPPACASTGLALVCCSVSPEARPPAFAGTEARLGRGA
eukprot:6466581-Alexandrium_andersonii.AAC.1